MIKMYIYRTRGICPSEIHFSLAGNKITGLNFVGGGCKGNAQLICRLLEGRGPDEALPLMRGIQCRNGTSCPDQLARAIEEIKGGELAEAETIRVFEDPRPRLTVAVIADLNGNAAALRAVLRLGTDALYCLGNITGSGGENDAVVELAVNSGVLFTLGPHDLTFPCRKPGNNDILVKAPHFLRCQLGDRKALGFYSGYIQELQGFSDFLPNSLELLMVSNLSDYLRKREVYPALRTMSEQFASDLVLFAHTGEYSHTTLGGVDYVNVGPVEDGGVYRYALLKWEKDQLRVSFETVGAA